MRTFVCQYVQLQVFAFLCPALKMRASTVCVVVRVGVRGLCAQRCIFVVRAVEALTTFCVSPSSSSRTMFKNVGDAFSLCKKAVCI